MNLSIAFVVYNLIAITSASPIARRALSGSYGGDYVDLDSMACIINSERTSRGMRPLSVNPRLVGAAEDHSYDQYRYRNMDHYGSDGSTVSDRAHEFGYPSSTVAENVAYNQETVEEVMDTWFGSRGHAANIMNPNYNHFGAGKVGGYWTQVFGEGDDSEDYIPTCY